MRSTHFGYGLLAAAGLLSTTAVHGQVQQAVDMTSNHSRSVSTIGVDIRDEPVTLAGAADPFSAARKAQGMNYSAANGAYSSSTANTSSPQSSGGNNQTDSVTPSSENKQPRIRDSALQSVVANTSDGNSQPLSTKSRSGSDAGDATTASPLQSLQQRLSSVRKTTTPSTTPETDARSPMSESVNTPTPAPAKAPTSATTMSPAMDMMPAPSTASSEASTTTRTFPNESVATAPGMASTTDSESDMSMPTTMPPVMPTRAQVIAPSVMAPAAASPLAGPMPAPAPPTNIPSTEVPESTYTSDVRSTQRSVADIEAIPSKAASTRSSYPVVSVAAAPTPVVGEPVNPARRGSAPTVSSDFNAGASQNNVFRSTAPSRAGATVNENVLFSHQSPVLEVETSGPRSISVGKEANYCVTITNAGELAAQNVEVSIKTPEWSEILRTKATNGETVGTSNKRGEPLIWRLPRLESHAKEQLTVRLVPRDSQSFDLAVQWTCSPAMSKAMVEVKEPKISLTLDGPSEILFGQTKVYRLTLANPGNGDAENVVLLLAPVDGGAGAPTRHEIGLIRAGETKPVEVELSARQAGKLSIKAMAVAAGNLKSEVAEDILVRRAGLKTAVNGPELKFAGTPVTYNVVIANPGNCTAESISASAILPAGAKFVNSPGGQFVEEENKVSWTIPSLRAGAEQELQLTCTLNSPGTNRIQVLATAAGDLNDNISTVTNVEALADLKLEVADPPGPLAVGEEMVYEVHIHNRGTKAAENVDVAGFFSNGIEPINAQGGPSEIAPGQIVFRPITAVAAGSEVVLRIKARASQPGNHVFRVEVNCPSVGAKLASEETTLFYGDGRPADERIAARPAAATQAIPSTDSPAPAVAR
jgi:uncharacterized repeat protein (TIGR01451 family)